MLNACARVDDLPRDDLTKSPRVRKRGRGGGDDPANQEDKSDSSKDFERVHIRINDIIYTCTVFNSVLHFSRGPPHTRAARNCACMRAHTRANEASSRVDGAIC